MGRSDCLDAHSPLQPLRHYKTHQTNGMAISLDAPDPVVPLSRAKFGAFPDAVLATPSTHRPLRKIGSRRTADCIRRLHAKSRPTP
jgi:hypothetical protein